MPNKLKLLCLKPPISLALERERKSKQSLAASEKCQTHYWTYTAPRNVGGSNTNTETLQQRASPEHTQLHQTSSPSFLQEGLQSSRRHIQLLMCKETSTAHHPLRGQLDEHRAAAGESHSADAVALGALCNAHAAMPASTVVTYRHHVQIPAVGGGHREVLPANKLTQQSPWAQLP